MPSIEQIQETLSKGYTLLSKEYVSRREKLEVECDKGHFIQQTWEAIQNKKKCPICSIPPTVTLEEAQKTAEERGYKLLSSEIKGNRELLDWECDKGHRFKQTWKNFKRVKTGCPEPECNPTARRKHEDVVEEFAREGYTLLSHYKSNTQNLEVICPYGNTFITQRARFVNSNQRCPCRNCTKSGVKLNFSEALERIDQNGFRYVSGEFEGVESILTLKCKEAGHLVKRRIHKIEQQCPHCLENSLKHDIEDLEKIAAKDGYRILSSKYVDSQTPLLFECNGISPSGIIYPEKHQYYSVWWNFKKGKRCQECQKDKKTIEYIQDFIKGRGLILLSKEYVDSKTHLEFKCKAKGHKFKKIWNSIQQDAGCPRCQKSSYGEEAITKILEHYGFKCVLQDRKILEGKELDIVIPSHKVAIEFCGLYFHSREILLSRVDKLKRISEKEKQKRRKRINWYHRDKLDLCQKKGYRLLTVFSDEWNLKKTIVLDRILSALGKFEKLNARDCEVSIASKEEAARFLDENHLQGSSPRKYSFKLTYSGEIVGILTLGRPNRAHITDGLEIKRLAFKVETQIRGGASKLFKFALKNIEKTPEIVSFCDLRYGDGQVYKALGFSLDKISDPSPHLTDGTTRKSYQSIAGRKMTDRWLKIYDCGHQKWVYTL